MLLKSRTIRIALRTAATATAAMLVWLTVVPAAERPGTGLEHHLEHFGAFLLPGILFTLGFEVRTRTMLVISIAFAAIIECMQIPLPTRHARLGDFVIDAAGICAGILIAYFAQAHFQRPHARQTSP